MMVSMQVRTAGLGKREVRAVVYRKAWRQELGSKQVDMASYIDLEVAVSFCLRK